MLRQFLAVGLQHNSGGNWVFLLASIFNWCYRWRLSKWDDSSKIPLVLVNPTWLLRPVVFLQPARFGPWTFVALWHCLLQTCVSPTTRPTCTPSSASSPSGCSALRGTEPPQDKIPHTRLKRTLITLWSEHWHLHTAEKWMHSTGHSHYYISDTNTTPALTFSYCSSHYHCPHRHYSFFPRKSLLLVLMQDIRFVSTRSLCSILNLSYWVFSLTIHPVAYMVFYSHHLIVFDIMLMLILMMSFITITIT